MYTSQLLCLLLVLVFNDVCAKRGGGGGGRVKSGGGWSWGSSSRGSSSPSHGSSGGWQKPQNTGASGATHGTPSHGNTGGWQKSPTKPAGNLPSNNIGPGGYPVQQNHPSRLPPYSPTDPRRNSPPPSYNSVYGSPQSWGPPPAYSSRASYYGVPSASYPRQSGFGYPGGQTYHQSSYHGYNMNPPTSNFNYGYPGSGSWGYQPQRSSSSFSSGLGGFLIGYQASSLVHSLSNPWGYGGYGYHNYRPWHRRDNKNNTTTSATNTTTELEPCVTYNTTNGLSTPVINPNCTCDPISFKDTEGREATQYRCTRKGEEKEDWNKLYKNMTEYAPGFKEYLPQEELPKGPQQLKLKALTPEGRREEAYSILEKIVNMGRFNVIQLAPITDST